MATTETDPFFSMCRHKIILVASTGCPVLAEKALQGVLESSVFDHTLSDAKLNAFLGKNEWIHTIYRREDTPLWREAFKKWFCHSDISN